MIRLIDVDIGSLEKEVNAVVEAVAVIVRTEQIERSPFVVVGAVDVNLFFIFYQLTEANELSFVQSLAAAQFE